MRELDDRDLEPVNAGKSLAVAVPEAAALATRWGMTAATVAIARRVTGK